MKIADIIREVQIKRRSPVLPSLGTPGVPSFATALNLQQFYPDAYLVFCALRETHEDLRRLDPYFGQLVVTSFVNPGNTTTANIPSVPAIAERPLLVTASLSDALTSQVIKTYSQDNILAWTAETLQKKQVAGPRPITEGFSLRYSATQDLLSDAAEPTYLLELLPSHRDTKSVQFDFTWSTLPLYRSPAQIRLESALQAPAHVLVLGTYANVLKEVYGPDAPESIDAVRAYERAKADALDYIKMQHQGIYDYTMKAV